MADFAFDPASGRYRNLRTGTYVTDASVRDAVDLVADAATEEIRAASVALRTGGMTLAEWQTEVMRLVKVSHVAASVAAHGGRAQMTQSDWGWVGIRIRAQYGWLREFAAEIADGTWPLDGRLDARAGLYGQSARVIFEAMRARDDAARGFDEERNVLHASESCAACVAESDRGWVEAGELAPIGTRTCLANCRCTITRRSSKAARTRRLLRAV